MPEIKLLRCPFCGGSADFNNDGEHWSQVICGSCGCRGCEHPGRDRVKAEQSWNRRTADTEAARLRAALLSIQDTAYSPQDDDHIWMDDRTTLGAFIDMTLAYGEEGSKT